MKSSRLLIPSISVWLAGAALLCSGTALAEADTLDQRMQARAQERAHVQGLRQQLEQRKAQAEKSCWERFAVEDCLREVRVQAREQEKQLHERELRINSADRQDKAQERLRSVDSRLQEKRSPGAVHMQSRGDAAVASPRSPAVGVTAPVDVPAVQAQRDAQASVRAQEQAQRLQRHQAEQAERARNDAQRRERLKQTVQQREQEAQQRRARKAQEMAERTGQPLPIPPEVQGMGRAPAP